MARRDARRALARPFGVAYTARVATDRELLERWAAGRSEAGEELFSRYFRPVCGFFANKVGTDVLLEDLVQRTFVACVEARARYRGDATFSTFLFGIAANVLREHYRELHRGQRLEDMDAEDMERMAVADLVPSPSLVVAERASDRLLLEALRHIPLWSQIIVEAHYWEGLTTAQLAQMLDIPQGTAKSRLRRARELLLAAVREAEGSGVETTQTDLDEWAAKLRDLVRS